MQPEAQLSLLSVEVTQADLRLYLAIKTSVSSSIVYVDHSHNSKLIGREVINPQVCLNTILITIYCHLIYIGKIKGSDTTTLKTQPELLSSVPMSLRNSYFQIISQFICQIVHCRSWVNLMLLPRRINTFKTHCHPLWDRPVCRENGVPGVEG